MCSMISKQVDKLKEIAEVQIMAYMKSILLDAADTIESLSAKLATANMERSRRYYCEDKKLIEAMAEEIENLYGKPTELTEKARKFLERSEQYYSLHKIIEELELLADDANDRTLTDVPDDMFYYDGKEDGIRLAIESIKSLIDEDTANVTEKKAD